MSRNGGICTCCGEWFGPNGIRPYGKDGTLICFNCMMAEPEREREGERRFAAMFDTEEKANEN